MRDSFFQCCLVPSKTTEFIRYREGWKVNRAFRSEVGRRWARTNVEEQYIAVELKILGKDGDAAEMLNGSTEKLGKSQLETLGWQVDRWYQLGVCTFIWICGWGYSGVVVDLDSWAKTCWNTRGVQRVWGYGRKQCYRRLKAQSDASCIMTQLRLAALSHHPQPNCACWKLSTNTPLLYTLLFYHFYFSIPCHMSNIYKHLFTFVAARHCRQFLLPTLRWCEVQLRSINRFSGERRRRPGSSSMWGKLAATRHHSLYLDIISPWIV